MQIAITHAVAELRHMYPPAASEPLGKAIAGLLLGTLVLAGLFYLLERLFPEQPSPARSPPGHKSGRHLLVFRLLRRQKTSHRRVHRRAHRGRRHYKCRGLPCSLTNRFGCRPSKPYSPLNSADTGRTA